MNVPKNLLITAGLCLVLVCVRGQAEPYGGYTLYNPIMTTTTYLIDEDNKEVHTWTNSTRGGYSVYLLENGLLLRPGVSPNNILKGAASSGLIQKINPDGSVFWEFEYTSSTVLPHHDIEPMPNGNVLIIAWEVKSAQEANAVGFNTTREVWPVHIIEVEPSGERGGNIVWKWHVWDHLVSENPEDHPELISVDVKDARDESQMGGDWLHINGISYNPESDQIVISSHFTDECYVIDHSTTTQEAASHSGGNSGKGGDILYRWGNPGNYDTQGDHYFDVIHCSWWIPKGYPGEGNIMVFNNGAGDRQSEIVEIKPPIDANGNYIITSGQAFGPSAPTWTYTESGFYSNHLGSCQRLPNGNTFICEATEGCLLEVESDGDVVWDYDVGSQVARAMRYASDYKGLGPLGITDIKQKSVSGENVLIQNYPNPFSTETTIRFNNITNCAQVKIFSLNGKELFSKTIKQNRCKWHAKNQPSGTYIIEVTIGKKVYKNYLTVIK